jgi:thiol-disulfide isomerase/thioredoxin
MTRKSKMVLIPVLTLVAGAALYSLNRYWIAPAMVKPEAVSRNLPLAPDFTVTDLSGEKVSLSGLRGKVVLLDFWATWCPPCRREIPGFVRLQKDYGDKGLTALGIVTQDAPQNVPPFYREFRMNYPVAMGNAELARLYGVNYGLPTTFLIGRDGRIYDKVVGGVDMEYFEKKIQRLISDGSSHNPAHVVAGFLSLPCSVLR